MNRSEQLSVFVATHLIDAATDQPLVDNLMIEKTIRTFHRNLQLGDVVFEIYPDARFERIHPEAYLAYRQFLDALTETLRADGLKVSIASRLGESMRENWEIFVEQCRTPYLLFLEHDWELLTPVPLDPILDTLDEHPEINYLKLTHQGMDLTERIYEDLATPDNWNWLMEEERNLKTAIPLTRVSFMSGNPHFQRLAFIRRFILPQLDTHCPLSESQGASYWEKDLQRTTLAYIDAHRDCGAGDEDTPGSWGHRWPLSEAGRLGKGCASCREALQRQQADWGTYLYGRPGMDAIIHHTGIWCRKR